MVLFYFFPFSLFAYSGKIARKSLDGSQWTPDEATMSTRNEMTKRSESEVQRFKFFTSLLSGNENLVERVGDSE